MIPTSPIAVVSPHLDDGVLACGALLAHYPGASLITVFAGRPAGRPALTPWDAACGFQSGDDVMTTRRAEDARGAAALGVRAIWLGLLDSQYGRAPAGTVIAATLERVLARTGPRTVLIPLGLFHSDHHRVHDAALTVMVRRPDIRWIAYEDAVYRRLPGLKDERVAALEGAGLRPRLVRWPVDAGMGRKSRAVAAYRSQRRGLGSHGRAGWRDALEPEGYWGLRP